MRERNLRRPVKRLGLIVAATALAGACGSSKPGDPGTPPTTITFQLHNDGLSTVYVFESCQIDFTITSLADPVHQVALSGGCACECGRECPVCGLCFEGPLDFAVGSMRLEYWNTVNVTTETTATGSCEHRTSLPDGPYRIDVPVYSTADDATARASARTATQSFTLPVTGNIVHVQLGVSP
jgi:hypothetical protein